MFGDLDIVRERLAALLDVLDSARAHPERWPEIKMRKVNDRHWVRDQPNPFVALGNGPAGPEFVRSFDRRVGPREPKEG